MRQVYLRVLLCGVFVIAAAACGKHDDGAADAGVGGTLAINPPSSTLMITDPTMPATQTFTATLTNADGTQEDVTANTVFTTNGYPGTFTGPTLSISYAGKITIVGTYTDPNSNQATATADVIIMITTVRVDPSLPPGVASLFGGSDDPTRAPTMVYPAPNVIVPRNLGDFEVHWKDSSNNDVYEVSLKTAYADIRAYVPATTPSADPATTPTTAWMAFLASEWANAVGAESSVNFQVRGVLSTASPATVGSSAVQTVYLSNEQMLGGLYYWSTASTSGVYGIFRHDMSMPGQPATEYLTSDLAPDGHACVACHVVSRDGTEMAVTFDGGGGISTMLDVGTTTLQTPTFNWDFGTFTADGAELIAVEGGAMSVRKYSDMTQVATLNDGIYSTHPDMSPDGTQLVYVTPVGTINADFQFDGGEIEIAAFDQTTNTLGAPRTVVADGSNDYYPTFSPDGQWILYTRAVAGSTQGASEVYSYNNETAELCVVNVAPGSTPIVLATANVGDNLTNSWGRWAPFAQTYGATSEPMYWITWSSKRDFGVRRINSVLAVADQYPQIWMSAFFPDRAAANMDPTAPAFRLPFQDFDSKNHIAQWTQQIVIVSDQPRAPKAPAAAPTASATLH